MPVQDLIFVENLGSEPITGAFNSNGFLIPPGERVMLDRVAAMKDWGDWTKRNWGREPHKRERDAEYRRIRGLYGVHEGARVPNGHDKDGQVIEVSSETILAERLPKVALFELTGEKIIGILDDPTGESLPLETADEDVLSKMVASQDDRIAKLEAMLEQALVDRSSIEAPVDSPDTAPRPKASKPKVTASQVSEAQE